MQEPRAGCQSAGTCFASPVPVTLRLPSSWPRTCSVIGMSWPTRLADRTEDRFRLNPGRTCRTSPTKNWISYRAWLIRHNKNEAEEQHAIQRLEAPRNVTPRRDLG